MPKQHVNPRMESSVNCHVWVQYMKESHKTANVKPLKSSL